MKNKIKNTIKFGILFLGILLFFTNCEQDFESVKHSNSQAPDRPAFKSSNISVNEIQQNQKLVSVLNGLEKEIKNNKSKIFEKEVYSSIYDFTIETEHATYIESTDGSYHSYTFGLFRTIDNGLLENLILSLQDDGTYLVILISYNLTAAEKEGLLNGQDIDLTNKTTAVVLEDTNIVDEIFNKVDSICYYLLTEKCTCNVHNSQTGYQDCDDECYESTMSQYCVSSGGSSTAETNTGGTNIGNTSSGGSGGVNSNNSLVTTPTYFPQPWEEIEACLSGLDADGNSNGFTLEMLTWLQNNKPQATQIKNYIKDLEGNCIAENFDFAFLAIEALESGLVGTFNEFLLNDHLNVNPVKLVDIDCSQIEYWQDLVQHIPPQSVLDRVNEIDSQHTTLFTDYEIQNLNNSYGKIINLDYFPVKVTTLPNNPSTGLQFTADEFLEYIRININDFVDPFWAQFSPIVYEDVGLLNDFSIDDTDLWLSNNPLGSIVHIEIPLDDGTVICTDYSNFNWTFTTLEVPWDDEHPVSGNRDFGYEINSDGSYTFYTRGVDRMTDAYDYIIEIAEDIIDNNTSEDINLDMFAVSTDPLWESFQNKISEFVNNPDNSGSATILEASKNRPDWVLVKDVLNGLRPISDLGCE